MSTCEPSALSIAQQALDGTDFAIQSGDFSAFAGFFGLPHKMEIDGKMTVITTMQGLKTVFDRFQKHLKDNRVTMIHRTCISAEFARPGLVHTTHETRLISGASIINDPYPVYSALQMMNGRWQIMSSQTAFPDTSRLGKSLLDNVS